MKLQTLIKQLKFDYVNSGITEKHFPYKKPRSGKYKIFKANKSLTGQELEDEIKKQGYSPATIYEFLLWASKEKNWKNKSILMLGSKWLDPDGFVLVPYAFVDGSYRSFRLNYFRGQFNSGHGVLVRCESLGHSDTQPLSPLETRVANLEKQMKSLLKIIKE